MSASKIYTRQVGIVALLRSREWVSADSLAKRFDVTVRTIYRDIDKLCSAGVPIESVSGPEGGYRLASDQPIGQTTLNDDEALKLYLVSLLEQPRDDAVSLEAVGTAYTREALRRLSQRIHFDTADWYWKDEGSGHLPAVRQALLTGTAVKLTTKTTGSTSSDTAIVKPYGIVWKSGEWHLVGEPIGESVARYRLNLVDQIASTDLRFTYPGEFVLREWWTQAMEDYGKGEQLVQLRVAAGARAEMSRLTLKTTSEVASTPDGGLVIRLWVDRWEWLIPLVTSYGTDVLIEQPEALRTAVITHLKTTLDAYAEHGPLAPGADLDPNYRNDDSRLRSTRGRAPIGDTRA
ncbi:helix-turn-helix transcriptional regulator [Nocardia asteroides]|uniref:helix-turn-helix transcriptional regulator n=1 Tax=Nocardia asteroides TaxID=1824 RepID=UPI001E3DC5EF|nr:WYL domain-containing protein [Nocardia asteroides]UGT58818.1 WYL domain-containing protein [Nocardia asteroides]